MALLLTPDQWGDVPQMVEVLDRIRIPRPLGGRPRTRPGHVSGDKAYSSHRNRSYLCRRHIQHTIPGAGRLPASQRERADHQPAQELLCGRPCYDKRAHVFHGTVTAAAIRLWLRQYPAGQDLHATASRAGSPGGYT